MVTKRKRCARYIYRRADNGQICTKAYAERYPNRTVKECVEWK